MTQLRRLPERLAPVLGRRWAPHVVLCSLALLLRVVWVLWVDREGFVLNDAGVYHATAISVNEGEGFRPAGVGPYARWPPGYPVLLAGVYRVFGTEPLWGELLNALIGAATVLLLMLLAERIVDRRTAIVAGTVLAVLPGPILWTDVLVTETLFTALFVGFFLLLAHASPTPGWVVAIGAMIGIGGLVRGEALTWGLLPIVLWWSALPRAALARRVALAALVAVVVLTPWTIRNYVVTDAFIPVATNASETLWSGHNEGATGGQVYPPDEYMARFDQEQPAYELQSSRALRNDAFRYMVANPLHELQLVPLKLIHLNRGDSYALDWVNQAPGAPPIAPVNVERIGVLADAGYYGLLTLTLLGAAFVGRRFWRRPIGRCIAASFLTALFLYGFLYYGNYRYRVPYEPLMVLVAATFLTRAWRLRRQLAVPVA